MSALWLGRDTTVPDSPLGVAPLAGVRVLDLTRLLPGGYATQILADLGADVLKIEAPGAGDYARTMAPLVNGVGNAFLAVNRNKRSAAINLKHPQGREALLRLVDGADILIESFRPGVMARLGLAHETLLARNPRLVVCALTGYGQDGPYRLRAGHDINYIGYAGLLAHLARPGQPPTMPGPQFADIAGGALMAVVGVLAALVGRAANGQGRIVDVSMLDGSLAMAPLLAAWLLNGLPEPTPDDWILSGATACYNVYETADGRYVTLGALEPQFWAEFCRRVGLDHLIPRQFPQDAADRDAAIAEVAALIRTKTRDAWVAELGDADVCLGPVNTLTEALADPQIRARSMLTYERASQPNADAEDDATPIPALRFGPLISDTPTPPPSRVVPLGAHTAEELAGAGYTADEIAALAAEGAIALT